MAQVPTPAIYPEAPAPYDLYCYQCGTYGAGCPCATPDRLRYVGDGWWEPENVPLHTRNLLRQALACDIGGAADHPRLAIWMADAVDLLRVLDREATE